MTGKKFPSYQNMIQMQAESSPRYSQYTGDVNQAPGQMNVLNRTLTMKVVNASNVSGTYTLFGYDVYGDTTTGTLAETGNDTYVTVTVLESSHAQVKRDSAKGPFWIGGMKMRTSNVDQFNNLLTVAEKSSTGALKSYTVAPTNFDSPNNQQPNLLLADPSQFSLNVGGMTYVTGTIIAGCTLTFTMTLAGRVNIGNVYDGDSAVVVSNAPYPTGQAPVVLQQGGGNGGVAQSIPMVSNS